MLLCCLVSVSVVFIMDRRNIALNLDDEYLVLSASSISADDLVRIGKFIGVIDTENKK